MSGISGRTLPNFRRIICKKENLTFYLEKTGLFASSKKEMRQLSGGMKRRVGLIQAMLGEPEFLIVDEPTTGLDPEERVRIRNLLVDFAKGRTVLFFHPRSRRYCGDVQQPGGHAKRDLSLYRNRAGSSEPCKRKDLDGGCLRRR